MSEEIFYEIEPQHLHCLLSQIFPSAQTQKHMSKLEDDKRGKDAKTFSKTSSVSYKPPLYIY